MPRKPPRRPHETPPGRNRTTRKGRHSAGGPRGVGTSAGQPRPEADRPRRPAAAGDAENRAFRGDRGGQGGGMPRRRDRGAGPRPHAGEGWIYGHHAVAAALTNPARRIERLVLTRDAAETLARAGIAPPLAPEIRTTGEISVLLPEGAAHQGFALRAAPLPARALPDVLAALPEGAPALVVVLDQVTDPRNVGAILRSAAAFAAAAVILPERHGADTTAALAKAASGALETVALVRVTNVSRALESLKGAGFWCVGLDARAPEALASVDLTGRIALVLGSEGSGLRRLVSDTCDVRARLPIGPGMESLNVSAAAAIALYEVARRRG